MRRSALAAVVLAAFALSSCASLPPPPPRRPRRPPSKLAKAILRTARAYLPEESRDLRTPRDCSDFVDRVFRANGVRLPRTSREMWRLGRPVASRNLRMGDLLFFSGARGGRRVGHVAIYDADGIFIHEASPADGVRLQSLYSDYYRERYLGARRILSD
ncbi:MAG: C40 family peptidase [Elusimicrobia bacterium]|nr:C40 family peptidase [Elusimicrobiota bacterium]